MSTIGTSACAIALTQSSRALRKTGTNFFRQLLIVTMSGVSGLTVANLVLLIFRGTTQVANAVFTVSGSNAVGSIDSNTTAMQTALSGTENGEIKTLAARLWDSVSGELLAEGDFEIQGVDSTYSGDGGATALVPVTGSTLKWGEMAMVGNKTYRYNRTTGLYREEWLEGAGEAAHLVQADTEIAIP